MLIWQEVIISHKFVVYLIICVLYDLSLGNVLLQIFLEPEDNGLVKSSRFQCPMGEHKCHQVAAALLFG